jgi:hypothetical protein
MDPIEGSETSANINQTLGIHPKIETVKLVNNFPFFFLGGRKGTRTPKHFVNLIGESKNFKVLEFPLNQLQTYYGCLCDLLSFM